MPRSVRPRTAAGERVEQARLRAGFKTQPDLAKAVGLATGTIWRVETGGYALGKPTAKKLAAVLKVTEAWLMYGDEGLGGPKRPVPFEGAVQKYLNSEIGSDTSDGVAQLLKSVDYSALAAPKPGLKEIHRVRETIEFNLGLGRKRPT
jgi:transcriptional regulator with XRE-family HTH domain